jgi:hypothetical protein
MFPRVILYNSGKGVIFPPHQSDVTYVVALHVEVRVVEGDSVTYVVALHVKVRIVEGDSVLLRGDYLPHTVLVGRIQVGERWTLHGAVQLVNVAPTRVYKRNQE